MKRPVSTLKRSWVILFISLIVTACTSRARDQHVVNLAIWGNYLSKQSEQRFTEKTGIRLNVMNYSSNEELLAKIQSGASGIDVAVPSDYMVEVMTKLDLLQPIEKEKIAASRTLAKDVINQPFDPSNRYSLPYAWAIAGIAVNRDLYKGPIHSWHDFFDNPALAGKISLLDDVREVTAAVLKMQGRSVNSISESELKLAKDVLLKIKKSVKMFTSDTVDILKNKEVVAAHSYSPDALQASAKTQGKIEFIIPTEGGTRYIDNLVIIKGAKHTDEAHKLIDFLLQKENEVEFVSAIRAGPVVAGIKNLLSLELQTSSTLFPSAQVLSKLERIHDLGDQNKLYEDIWTAVKSSE